MFVTALMQPETSCSTLQRVYPLATLAAAINILGVHLACSTLQRVYPLATLLC